MRLFDGSLGFHVRPRNTAKVKIEFTWTMPSSAEMWMLVARAFREDEDDGGEAAIAAGGGRREKVSGGEERGRADSGRDLRQTGQRGLLGVTSVGDSELPRQCFWRTSEFTTNMGIWSSGMILALVASGPKFDSWNAPF